MALSAHRKTKVAKVIIMLEQIGNGDTMRGLKVVHKALGGDITADHKSKKLKVVGPVDEFISCRYQEAGPNYKEKVAFDVYKEYQEWCIFNDEDYFGKTHFYNLLRNMDGVDIRKAGANILYVYGLKQRGN